MPACVSGAHFLLPCMANAYLVHCMDSQTFDTSICCRDGGTPAAYGQHPMADTERAELIPEQAASSSSSVGRAQRHRKAWRWLDLHIDRRIFSAAAVVSRVSSPFALPQSSARDQKDVHVIRCVLSAAAELGRESLHLPLSFLKLCTQWPDTHTADANVAVMWAGTPPQPRQMLYQAPVT